MTPLHRVRLIRLRFFLIIFAVFSLTLFAPQSTQAATCGGLPDNGTVPPGTYTFPAGCVHTTVDTLVIDGDVTILGNGGTLTPSGPHRIIAVNPGASLVLNGVTVRDGHDPDASTITNNRGTLTIANSHIVENMASLQAGAIMNFMGTLIILDSNISNNAADPAQVAFGGAFFNWEGHVTIQRSTFSGNSVHYYGGAIFSLRGSIDIEDSRIVNNTAGNFGTGGAIENTGSIITIRNSVISGNYSPAGGGGLSNAGGTYNLCSTTVTNNTPDDFAGYGIINIEESCDPPPPPMCNTLDEDVQAFDLPDGIYCRTLFDAGGWQANPGSVPFIDGMLLAVEVFRIDGRTVAAGDFGAGIPVCLPGQGRLILYDASASPRVPVAMETFTAGEMTCAYLINPGTLVLVRE